MDSHERAELLTKLEAIEARFYEASKLSGRRVTHSSGQLSVYNASGDARTVRIQLPPGALLMLL